MLPPRLNPCLSTHWGRRGNQLLVKLGDNEVDVSPDFHLWLVTKLPNPVYSPEVASKALIVNFAVKMSGLEAQLLDAVVRHERPDLAKQKSELVAKVCHTYTDAWWDGVTCGAHGRPLQICCTAHAPPCHP